MRIDRLGYGACAAAGPSASTPATIDSRASAVRSIELDVARARDALSQRASLSRRCGHIVRPDDHQRRAGDATDRAPQIDVADRGATGEVALDRRGQKQLPQARDGIGGALAESRREPALEHSVGDRAET